MKFGYYLYHIRIRSLPDITAMGDTEIFWNNGSCAKTVWKELYYGKADTLEDVEEAVRGWRDNPVG
jgi:hypothetical protein